MINTITVEKLKAKKIELKNKIISDIEKFNKETSVRINEIDVSIDYSYSYCSKFSYSANIELDI